MAFGALRAPVALAVGAAAAACSRRRHKRLRRCRVQLRVASVYEFFCGIGGFRTAYRLAAGADASLPRWRALEVDETCCKVYSELFGSGLQNGVRAQRLWEYAPGQDEIWRCSIDKLPDEAFEGGDLWLLSPPCQPFTRTGNHLDINDKRCAALLRLLEALPNLSKPPQAMLLENVPEFLGSKAHARLRKTLDACKQGYDVEEFVLDPTDFGFPNTRKRFYLLATATSSGGSEKPLLPLPGVGAPVIETRPIRDFCPGSAMPPAADLQVQREMMERALAASWQVDVATASSTATKTFMASYGKVAYGSEGLSKAGPLLMTEADGLAASEQRRRRFGIPKQEFWPRIRYFAPSEILALQGFPEGWALPSWLQTRQKWRLIGNSINVEVVRRLMERLLSRLY